MGDIERRKTLFDQARTVVGPELYLILGVMELGATFFAHLGNHLAIHLQIAEYAMGAEFICVTFSAAAIAKRNTDKEAYLTLSRVALAALFISFGCVAAVPLTDWKQYPNLVKNVVANPNVLGRLATCWANDAKRQILYGVQYRGRQITDPDAALRACTGEDWISPRN